MSDVDEHGLDVGLLVVADVELLLLGHLLEGEDVDEAVGLGHVGAGEPEEVLEEFPGLLAGHLDVVHVEGDGALDGGVDHVVEVEDLSVGEGHGDVFDGGGLEAEVELDLLVESGAEEGGVLGAVGEFGAGVRGLDALKEDAVLGLGGALGGGLGVGGL